MSEKNITQRYCKLQKKTLAEGERCWSALGGRVTGAKVLTAIEADKEICYSA